MSTRDELTPTMERELQAVEDALATGTATATDRDERELRELALALRADAPTPDPAFAAALRKRIEAGFPHDAGSVAGRLRATRARLRRTWEGSGARGLPRPGARSGGGRGGRRLLDRVTGAGLGAGAVAALLIAIVVAVSLTGGDRNTTGDVSGGGSVAPRDSSTMLRQAAPEEAAPVPGDANDAAGATEPATPDTGVAVPPRGGGDFAPGREQRIARSAALTLAAPGDELGRLAERVTAVTDRQRGFVLRSSVTSGDEGAAGGTLELRIPAAQLRAALRDLSALAAVTSSTQSGEDVTGRFVSARDRLDAARAERTGLLKRLENAGTDVEAEAIRRRLDLVAGEINGLRGQLRELRLLTSYAAVTVALEAEDGSGGTATGSTEDALDDALGSLQAAVNVALRALGVGLPVAILVLLAWLTTSIVRRRRRESALA